MSVAILIPARYASSRYPGKPLAPLTGATGEANAELSNLMKDIGYAGDDEPTAND